MQEARTARLQSQEKSDTTGADMDRYVGSIDHNLKGPLEPVSDPHRTLFMSKRRLAAGETKHTGRILLAMPSLNWYLVEIGELKGSFPCYRGETDSAPSIVGIIDTCVLPPDTPVSVSFKRNGLWGRIESAIPTQMTDGNQNFSDAVVQGSGTGFFQDGYVSQYVANLQDEGGVINWCNSRPIDSLIGDWGKAAYTGTAFHLDKDLIYLRVSEICGVFGFYPSNTLRIAGYHLETSTAGSASYQGNDEGEFLAYYGETPYPHEALGVYTAAATVHRTNTEKAVLLEKAESLYEPKHDDQVPFHRYEEYGGYLGQGRIRQMQAPPKDYNDQSVHRLSSPELPITLWREHVGMDGEYSNVTAKGFMFVKRPTLVTAKRVKEHDSLETQADNPGNYKAAGLHGTGDEHKVGDLAPQGHDAYVSSVAILDGVVHELNWKSVLGFDYHEKDFKLQQESASDLGGDFTGLDYGQLSGSYAFTSRPPSTEVKIDERMMAKIYKILTAVVATDDGALCFTGGGGAELKLAQGCAHLNAPGTVYIQSGGRTIVIAGDDYVVKANKSIDLTAANGDWRASAYKNMQLCSAISGAGGMLFESKSQNKEHDYPADGGEQITGSGVLFKAAKSEFGIMAAGIYGRTGNDEVEAGNIVFDAAKGEKDLILIAKDHQRFVKGQIVDAFGYPKVEAVNTYSQTACRMGMSAYVEGNLSLKGTLRAEQSVLAIKGSIQSRSGGQVNRIQNPGVEQQVIDDHHKAIDESQDTAQTDFRDDVQKVYYESGKIGEKEMQRKVAFCFRREEDYGTQGDFFLEMTLWQHLGESVGGLTGFQEHEVEYQQKKFMPWPGFKAWTEQPKFLALPAAAPTMYDLAAQRGKDRRTSYEEAKYPQLAPSLFASAYKVINTT